MANYRGIHHRGIMNREHPVMKLSFVELREKIPVNAAFCPFCGFRFEEVPQDTQPSPYPPEPEPPVYQQPADQPIPTILPAPDAQGGPAQKKKKSNIPAIAAIVFAALAAMLIGFLFIAPLIAGKVSPSASANTAKADEGTDGKRGRSDSGGSPGCGDSGWERG